VGQLSAAADRQTDRQTDRQNARTVPSARHAPTASSAMQLTAWTADGVSEVKWDVNEMANRRPTELGLPKHKHFTSTYQHTQILVRYSKCSLSVHVI